MNRRTAAVLAFSLALGQPLSGWAQREQNASDSDQNNGGPSENESEDARARSNGESSSRQGNPNGSRDGGDAAAGSTAGYGRSDRAAAPNAPGNEHSADELTQDDVLAAVEAGDAVPLRTILPDVRIRTGGEVIEAKLQRIDGFLIYAITALNPVGEVSIEYYYARSGIHVNGR
jgi:hypothetical protein